MSDTPRTDASLVNMSGAGMNIETLFVQADFARKLERELTKVTAQRDGLADIMRAIDPMPNEPLDSSSWQGAAYCEISIGEMRAIREALATVKGHKP